MTSPILLTGGTGNLGSMVLPLLQRAGRTVRVLSRSERSSRPGLEFVRGDLETGDGIDRAVDGIGTILHCAGSTKADGIKARNLLDAATSAGVQHIVYISVVGADRIPQSGRLDRAMFGYFGEKRAAEIVVAESSVPWTTLRASQFHDLMLTAVRAMAKLPVIPAPSGFRFQPVDTAEVADRLVELTLSGPAGLVPDLAGPQIYEMADLIRCYLQATGKRRPVVSVRLPGRAAAAIRSGANLAPDRSVGHRTWEEFLAQRVAVVAATGGSRTPD